MHLTKLDNQKRGLTKVVNKYLGQKKIDLDNRFFNFQKSIKIWKTLRLKCMQLMIIINSTQRPSLTTRKELLAFWLNFERPCWIFMLIMILFLRWIKKVPYKHSKRSRLIKETEDYKQAINQSYSIISTNKSWK